MDWERGLPAGVRLVKGSPTSSLPVRQLWGSRSQPCLPGTESLLSIPVSSTAVHLLPSMPKDTVG